MLKEKRYQVVLKNGINLSKVYNTVQQALTENKGNVKQIVELLPISVDINGKDLVKKKVDAGKSIHGDILLISQRSDEDLELSKDCGYAVMYNCPSEEKIYSGMVYLEVSKDKVLEGRLDRLEYYEKTIHSKWNNVTPRFPDKQWKYVIFHKNSEIFDRKEMEKKYNNNLKGVQGGISYIKSATTSEVKQ